MDRSESIRRQFGAAAERYAVSSYHQTSPDLLHMLEASDLSDTARVLDVGTGTGHTALAFAPRVAQVTGIDLTEAMLDQARRLAAEQGAGNVSFERADAMALGFPDAHFDAVTCRVCAHHFADPVAAVREATRVIRPGGQLLLVDTVAPPDPAQDTFLNTIELLRDPSHVRNYSVSEWEGMLRAAGLETRCEAQWSVPLDFEDWVERMGTPELERTQLRRLFDTAPDVVRDVLGLRGGDEAYGFDIPVALFVGTQKS
jgi:SAM-dependent methyltransferase